MKIAAVLVASVVACVSTSFDVKVDGPRAGTPQLALGGRDPVALCEGRDTLGDQTWTAARGRFTYHFENEAALARFRAEPERFAIQWGGGCGRMGPLSGTGDQTLFTVHDGRVWVFASPGCKSGFESAPEKFVVKAPEPVEYSAEQKERGAAWLARAIAAHGGEALSGARGALLFEDDGTQDGWSNFEDLLVAFDGSLYARSRWIGPEKGQGFDGLWVLATDTFVVEDGEHFDVHSPDQITDLRRMAQRQPLLLLAAASRGEVVAAELGRAAHGERELVEVAVECAQLATTLLVDPETARIAGLSWRGRLADGPTRDVVELFDTYVDASGLVVPDARRVTVDGKDSRSHSKGWDRVRLVAERPAAAFVRATCLEDLVVE
jgi:YHS domain-containing protein